MGELLPFGRGIDDDSENQPISGVPVSPEEEEAVEQAIPADPTSEPAPVAAEAPQDPRITYQAIDQSIKTLRALAGQLIKLLPPGAIAQDKKQDLLSRYTALEASCVELQGRLVPASGDPINAEVVQEHEHLKLDVQKLTEDIGKHLEAAGITALGPHKPPISKTTSLYIGLGITALLVAGGIYWAYRRNNE